MVLWLNVRDTTAGFVCYRASTLRALPLNDIHFIGYAFQIEMKFTAWKLGFKVVEVPITFTDRQHGESKMSKGIIKEGVLGVIKIQWQSLFRNYRRKIRKT
jgi:dolichol-phosphate mannosyltransferase